LTDTNFCDYTFPDLNNIIIEANFCHDIIKKKYSHSTDNGIGSEFFKFNSNKV